MADSVYVLDANVFIEASRRYYAFDLAPGFWHRLSELANEGKIESIDRVKGELDKGKDELAEWTNSHFLDAFKSTNNDKVVQSYRAIIAWVTQGDFLIPAKSEFADGADGWLVAYSKANKRTVVTHEVLSPAKRKVPIPNVCQEFNVPYIDTFEMLRKLGVRWLH